MKSIKTKHILGSYTNGNYSVQIFSDGTKIRRTEEDNFIPEFPESIDLKITNYCQTGCPWCHENSTLEGKHSDLMSLGFINTLRPYTEIAIGGGNPLSHPGLVEFLLALKDKDVIANMTVNQSHLTDSSQFCKLKTLIEDKLIVGVGVSFTKMDRPLFEQLEQMSPNIVFHLIAGIHDEKTFTKLASDRRKILILGYKKLRRGVSFELASRTAIKANTYWLNENIKQVMSNYRIVSFDNLAITQLQLQRRVHKEVWDTFYLGDDGTHTMYIDGVEKEYSISSTTKVRFPLEDDIIKMFTKVRNYDRE